MSVIRHMKQADEYRARAADCERRAAQARDAVVRKDYAEMARQWREMAAQIDKRQAAREKA